MFPTILPILFISLVFCAKNPSLNEPHCGLPSFANRLPAREKGKVESIWENYESGDDCEFRRAETKKVLASLPAQIRNRVLFDKSPAFLHGASSDIRKQFEDLWNDRNIPRTEKPEKYKELAEKVLNATQMKEFTKFYETMVKRRDEYNTKLAALSPEARTAHEKLAELREQRRQLYENLSESAKEELNNLYKHEHI